MENPYAYCFILSAKIDLFKELLLFLSRISELVFIFNRLLRIRFIVSTERLWGVCPAESGSTADGFAAGAVNYSSMSELAQALFYMLCSFVIQCFI